MRRACCRCSTVSYSVGQIHKYSVGALQDARGGDRARRRLPAGLQHPPRPHAGPAGRIQILRRRRRDDRRHRGQVPDPRAGQGDLAAVQHRRAPRRAFSIRRTATSSRPTSPRPWRAARATRGGEINRNTTVTAIERAPSRRVAGRDRQGRHHLRARRLRSRQFRPPDRPHGRPQRAGHPGRAPVYRHRAASGDPGAQGQGPARDGRAARVRFLLVHARGGGRPAARPLREGRAGLLRRRAVGGERIRAVPGGSRAADAAYRDRDRARAGLRRGRHQEGLQRRHRLYAGRLARSSARRRA